MLSVEAHAERQALALSESFPLVLNAGWHMRRNANTLMRDLAWLGEGRGCTLAMNPRDAGKLGLSDGQRARVTTEAGQVEVELEVTGSTRPGMVLMPHGFGLVHDGEARGANVNRLTSSAHRDPIAGTRLHRFVPCRVEPV